MFNCSAGKDRTGVVSAVILGLCGVSDEDIISDYMLTKENNKRMFEEIHNKYPFVNMELIIPTEKNMSDFLMLFREKYGGFFEYLVSVGVTEEEIENIRGKLI